MFSNLRRRKLLQIQATKSAFNISAFLNSLVTNKVSLQGIRQSQPQPLQSIQLNALQSTPKLFSAAFLSPQGRVLMDTMIYYNREIVENGFLLEVDSSMIATLQAHLKRYILRSPIQVSLRDDLDVVHSWNENGNFESIAFSDPRHPLMGRRGVMLASDSFIHRTTADENDYLAHRTIIGVGEGPDDFLYNSSLPLELNLDLTNGVDFKKGCYLGQELTHRTKHLGVIRKRLVRLMLAPSSTIFSESNPPQFKYIPSSHQSAISANTQLFMVKDRGNDKRRAVGRSGTCIGNIGLGVVKLDHVIGYEVGSFDIEGMELETDDGIRLYAFSSPVISGPGTINL